jgi:uncharacterized protein YqgV (UPF0045/DUF77 family)
MSVDIIPSGSSAVVTDDSHDWDVDMMTLEAVKDAEAQLSKQIGDDYADTVKTVKDAEAQLSKQVGDVWADVVKTAKDVEAQLARQMGMHTTELVQDIKDAESRTTRDAKDAETRLDRAAADRFIQTIQDVKEVDKHLSDKVETVESYIKDARFELERSNAQTREEMAEAFKFELRELEDKFQEMQKTQYQLSAAAAKQAYENELRNVEHFGKQALLSEKLAAQASKELCECCCEIREAIGKDGAETRELINDIERDRLRDKSDSLQDKLAAYFAAKVPPVVP